MNKYSINVQWSDEDDCFVAMVPEFPTLIAFGETQEEALAEAKIALHGFIAIYQEDGLPLPDPKCAPSHSGQIRVRMSRDLHAALAKEAERQGVSLNSLIVIRLSENNIMARIEDRLNSLDSQFSNLLLSGIPTPKPESGPTDIVRIAYPDESKTNQTGYGTC